MIIDSVLEKTIQQLNIKWFQSYLSNCKFTVHLQDLFSEISSISCRLSQVLVIYVNDCPVAVKCNLFFYVDDISLVFQGKNVKDIAKQLNEEFANICICFVDNKLSIHFGENKTKFIFFASKCKIKKHQKVCIIYNKIREKQHS